MVISDYDVCPDQAPSSRTLAQLARRSLDSPRNFESMQNPTKRQDAKRAATNMGTGRVAHKKPRRGGRHANNGDDSKDRVCPMTQAMGIPVHTTRHFGMCDIPGRGAMEPMYANDAKGLEAGCKAMGIALARSGDSIGCLDLEWGRGKGRRAKARQGAAPSWDWPAILQVGVRGERALIVDLQAIVRGSREVDPRKMLLARTHVGAHVFGESAKQALFVKLVQDGHDTVRTQVQHLKTAAGKQKKTLAGISRMGTTTIQGIVRAGTMAGRCE